LTASLNHKTRHGLRTIAFSSDGKTISTASWDGTARLWDAATGAAIGPPVMPRGQVEAIAFGPDGRAVLTVGQDGVARIRDVATGAAIGAPITHQ
jgi:WD40 repeat protein